MITGTSPRSELPKFKIFMAYQHTDWYADTGANNHICSNIFSFISYQNLRRKIVTMGNTVAQVFGQES